MVMLEVAIIAGREAERALDQWLSQTLAEYRGSRTAWDLKATTVELRLEFARFDEILGTTADRLLALIPGLVNGIPGYVSPSESRPRRRRCLDEVAAVSGLLTAIDPRIRSVTLPRDQGAVPPHQLARGNDGAEPPGG